MTSWTWTLLRIEEESEIRTDDPQTRVFGGSDLPAPTSPGCGSCPCTPQPTDQQIKEFGIPVNDPWDLTCWNAGGPAPDGDDVKRQSKRLYIHQSIPGQAARQAGDPSGSGRVGSGRRHVCTHSSTYGPPSPARLVQVPNKQDDTPLAFSSRRHRRQARRFWRPRSVCDVPRTDVWDGAKARPGWFYSRCVSVHATRPEERRRAESAQQASTQSTVVAANQVSNEPYLSPTRGSIPPMAPRVGHTAPLEAAWPKPTLPVPAVSVVSLPRFPTIPSPPLFFLPTTTTAASSSPTQKRAQSPSPGPPPGTRTKPWPPPEPPPPSGTGFFGMLSFRRSATAVASFDPAQDDELLALDALQAHVADRLSALSAHAAAAAAASTSSALSLPFLAKLLDAVLSSDAAFRAVLAVAPAPSDRLASDLLDRAVKTLDVLNAASLTLASLRAAHRAALAAASCLLAPSLHRAHLARARRAIARLFPTTTPGSPPPAAAAADARPPLFPHHAGALSFSVSKNWSAGRHMNAMAAHLAPPPTQATAAVAGAAPSFVSPCGRWDRASAAQAQWAAPMSALQDRIAEEWRRREKKGSFSGSCRRWSAPARDLNSLLEEIAEEQEEEEGHGIVGEDRAREVTERAEELAAACRALEEGWRRLSGRCARCSTVSWPCRAEVVRCIDHSTRRPPPPIRPSSASGVPPQHQHSF
ncbi:hypothetical protein HU200_012534 [Digitaria exilis]|uniref:Uncharacterized protein n=1 Tax=Digitaria exilis TaxID=1010633 RepID=A0A835FG46_9POAL|nr:hypothetical protein HU200_012534 [Digitaria exilis]